MGVGDVCSAWEGVVAIGECGLAAGLARVADRVGRGLWYRFVFVGAVCAACA